LPGRGQGFGMYFLDTPVDKPGKREGL